MKIRYAFIVIVLMVTVLVLGQTRRPKEMEYVRKEISIEENQDMTATVRVCDPDGDSVEVTFEDLPPGAIISDTYPLIDYVPDPNDCDSNDPNAYCDSCVQGSSWYARDIIWNPDYTQSGDYKIYVHAVDDKGADDWVVILIHVADKNRPPQL